MLQNEPRVANQSPLLSEKDARRREFVLNGNLWRVLFTIGTPLAVYQSLGQIFKILDTMIASHISAESVSTVAYLSQINMMFAALGGGLAVGASIKVSEAYGAGDYPLVKKRISTLFAFCLILGALIVCLIPFTPLLLRMANTPELFIQSGADYFNIGLLDIAVTFFNNAYIAVERARGNTVKILWLNSAAIAMKLGATAAFVYIFNGGVTMIGVATLLSDLLILVCGCWALHRAVGIFSFSCSQITFSRKVAGPMVWLSIPVVAEKAAFSFGKVVVNSMSTVYGELTVGALGISNHLGGLTTNPQNGFQEGGVTVISQNVGAGNFERALDAFKRLLVINGLFGLAGCSLTLAFLPALSALFSAGNPSFQIMIRHVYQYEAWGAPALGLCSAALALLYGFGYTRITLCINFCRVFLFRIPVLWGLQNFTALGSESVGVVMLVSNLLVSLMALALSAAAIRQICLTHGAVFFRALRRETC